MSWAEDMCYDGWDSDMEVAFSQKRDPLYYHVKLDSHLVSVDERYCVFKDNIGQMVIPSKYVKAKGGAYYVWKGYDPVYETKGRGPALGMCL